MPKKILLSLLLMFAVTPTATFACACGCGVFDVGTGTMIPNGTGGTVWLEYDYMDQNKNWSGTRSSDGANNPDKEIVNNFFVAGGQYMFSRDWGAEIDVPYTRRTFNTTGDDGGPASFNHAGFGDMRVKGIYSGFSDDMSTGLVAGLKLPTGDSRYPDFDRDTSLGTGGTDWSLGGYHTGALIDSGSFNWFANGQWEHAFTVRDHYRPGDEWDVAIGSYYNDWTTPGGDKIAPLLQLIGSYRLHDVGVNADPQDSGYRRLLLSPGVEYDVDAIRLYADIEVPVYQNVNGNQLTAPVLTKFVVGYNF